jgi:DNA-binding transcriptional ArsR family regulator
MATSASPKQIARDPARLKRARDYLANDPARSGMARLRKAICDPARLEIIRALTPGPLSVNDLALAVDRAPAATSQHLRVLREMGLVGRERRGTTIYYSVSKDNAAALQRLFNSLAAVEHRKSA